MCQEYMLTKFDDVISSTELVKNIAKDLIIIPNPIVISSKTGYGIHRLKNMINECVSPEEAKSNHSTRIINYWMTKV